MVISRLRKIQMIKRLWHNTSNDSTLIMQYILTSWQEELVVVVDHKHPLMGVPSVWTYVGTWHIPQLDQNQCSTNLLCLLFGCLA